MWWLGDFPAWASISGFRPNIRGFVCETKNLFLFLTTWNSCDPQLGSLLYARVRYLGNDDKDDVQAFVG